MSSNQVWDYIKLDHIGSECKNCGQELMPTMQYCKMCNSQMEICVLPICRSLITKTKEDIIDLKSQAPSSSEKLQDKTRLREVAIAKVIDRFLFDLAARTSKFQKALDTEGVWFSHVCCYLMMKNVRPLGIEPADIAKDPLYKMMRDTFYNFFSKGAKSLDKETRETILSVFKIPRANLDGSKVLLNMIFELERQEKLQIYREKNKCAKCGAETAIGQIYCTECEDQETLKNRQAISSTMPAPLVQPSTPAARQTGMHMKKETEN